MVSFNSPWFPMAVRYIAGASVARQAEVTLTRRWLGFESAPRRFIIAIIPPKP
jgi:hypothetical protein